MNYRGVYIGLILVLALNSCVLDSRNDNYDTVSLLGPYITVSQTEAAVGEFVEVTMIAELSLFQLSTFAEQSGDVEIGLCLGPDWATKRENCDVIAPGILDFQPSDAFTIEPEGGISRRDVVTVKRGETVEFTHRLRITANRPGTVSFSVAFVSHETETNYFATGGTQGPSVTFR